MKNTLHYSLLLLIITLISSCNYHTDKSVAKAKPQPYVLMIQPIVTRGDDGTHPAPTALPEQLVDSVYSRAGIDFLFLEPLYYNSTAARDGLINLDEICRTAQSEGMIKGQGDIVNMFFVNKVDGISGPLGRGMMYGNITFIALGDSSHAAPDHEFMQAFVIAHEVGHNLGLQHAIDDPLVPDSLPNIMGDGAFEDRINPCNSLNKHQIEQIRTSQLVHPRCEFLSPKQSALAIVDESFEPYFSQLQARELSAFLDSTITLSNQDSICAFARKAFAASVTTFTHEEQACITWVVNNTNRILEAHQLTLMSRQPWRFIKVKNNLCGGFAHTRGTFIILSERHINHLKKGWSEHMTSQEENTLLENFGALLVHEQLHALQRCYPSRFARLYTQYWNFIPANVQSLHAITLNQVSNPDAPVAQWLIATSDSTWYWPRTLLKGTNNPPVMGRDFEDLLFAVEKNGDHYSLIKDGEHHPVSIPLSSLTSYARAFPVNRGIDHPNEISAYMLADYFKALIHNEPPFQSIDKAAEENTHQFLQWIKQNMQQDTKL